jgi:hypothetical protein
MYITIGTCYSFKMASQESTVLKLRMAYIVFTVQPTCKEMKRVIILCSPLYETKMCCVTKWRVFFMLKQVVHIFTIFYILLYGCKTWLLVHRPGVFGNGVLRKRSKGGWGELQETRKNCTMRNFIICIRHRYHQMITSPGTRWAGHVAHLVGEEKCVQSFGRKT